MKLGKMVPSRPLVQLIKDKVEKTGNGVIYILDGNCTFTQVFLEIYKICKLGLKLLRIILKCEFLFTLNALSNK